MSDDPVSADAAMEGAGGRLGEEGGRVDESYLFLAEAPAIVPLLPLLSGRVCGGRNESLRGGGLVSEVSVRLLLGDSDLAFSLLRSRAVCALTDRFLSLGTSLSLKAGAGAGAGAGSGRAAVLLRSGAISGSCERE